MNEIDSISLFVGTGQCNANCSHCAGLPLRKYAPKEDGIIDEDLIRRTIKESYAQGARYLSISSSGEPTLSPLAVTKTLELVHGCDGIEFSPINLYSNGIRIGEDESFCKKYLRIWKSLGLTTVYITVHDIDEKENARIYGIKSYPSINLVLRRIHNAGLLMRANIVLSKKSISTIDSFVSTVGHLKKMGVDCISAWPIRGRDDRMDPKLSPPEDELDKMDEWVDENNDLECRIRLLREKDRIMYQTGRKMTLFPDGTLSNTWCNH